MPNSQNRKAWEYLEERFGVERSDIEEYSIKLVSGDYWLVSRQMKDLDIDVETYGVRFLRKTGRGLKPTTYGLQIIGDRLEKNVVEVDQEELEKLLAREDMIPRDLEKDGYVAVKFEDDIIGCGYYMDDVVSSWIPKGRSRELLNLID